MGKQSGGVLTEFLHGAPATYMNYECALTGLFLVVLRKAAGTTATASAT